MSSKCATRLGWLVALALVLSFSFNTDVRAAEVNIKKAMRFAADMARKGNWREAAFRWNILLKDRPDDPRVLNNLAVANEVLGKTEEAKQFYTRSFANSKDDLLVGSNVRRFERFWAPVYPELGWDELPMFVEGKSRLGKPVDVTVPLPVPPRLEVNGESLLVASFLHEESDLFDIDRELVRFVRREFRKSKAELDIQEINPPPAVPEQTLEDLINNSEFWRFLGRKFESEIIVSGQVRFDRGDASTFKDVDTISNVTGQKVRSTRFVEQEEFVLTVDLIFMNAKSGDLMFRDRIQRGAIFPGLSNDPITAFFALNDTLVGDILSVVTTQSRNDLRVIFR